MKTNLIRKKTIAYVFLLSILLFGCSIPANVSQSEEHEPQTESTVPPTATLEPTAALEPTSTPDPLIFQDDFEDSIDTEWQWIRENDKKWSLTNNPGWLEIHAGSGHVSKSETENILVRQIPEGNFELETKLIFEPVTNYQFAGLLIYENDANFIQYGRAYCVDDPRCVGDGLYLDNTMRGEFIIGDNYATSAPDTDTLYLRFRREGNTFTSYLSEDGIEWQMLGSHANNMDPIYVGLVAGQSIYSFQPAQFDYFIINALP